MAPPPKQFGAWRTLLLVVPEKKLSVTVASATAIAPPPCSSETHRTRASHKQSR